MRGVGCSLITLPVSIKLYRSMSGSLEGDVPEKIHTPTTDGILEILTGGGGSKTLETQVGGGLNMKKSSAGVISTNSSRNLNV